MLFFRYFALWAFRFSIIGSLLTEISTFFIILAVFKITVSKILTMSTFIRGALSYVEKSSWTLAVYNNRRVVSESYRLKLHGGPLDGYTRRTQGLLRILPGAPRRLSPCWAGGFLVRLGGDHAP